MPCPQNPCKRRSLFEPWVSFEKTLCVAKLCCCRCLLQSKRKKKQHARFGSPKQLGKGLLHAVAVVICTILNVLATRVLFYGRFFSSV